MDAMIVRSFFLALIQYCIAVPAWSPSGVAAIAHRLDLHQGSGSDGLLSTGAYCYTYCNCLHDTAHDQSYQGRQPQHGSST
jgi:hypothetical protein